MRKRNKLRPIKFSILSSNISMMVILSIIIFLSTYLNFSKNINDSVLLQTKEISRQIIYNYENYFNQIINTSNLIQADVANIDIRHDSKDTSHYLNRIVRLMNEIIRIDLYDTSGFLLASSMENPDNPSVPVTLEWFAWAKNEPTIHFFSNPYEVQGQFRLTISKYIPYNHNTDHAILRIEINFDNIINLSNNANLGPGGFITIIDSNYRPIYSSKPHWLPLSDQQEREVLQSLILGSRQEKVGSYEMMIHVDTLTHTRWRICVFSNIDQFMAIRQSFFQNIIVITLLTIIGGSFILLGLSNRITNPLKQLESIMRRIEQNEEFILQQVNIEANNREVASLTNGFNHMMRRIKELMDKIVIEQKEQRKSELKALQNQIQPHFLYNTLDSITWLIEQQHNREATEMVIALAKFFRISLSKGKNVIPIQDELEHVRSYLIIQSYRYRDAFDYEFIVDHRVLKYPVLKLLLQPLVENAIYHGLKHSIDRGKIVIRAEDRGTSILLSVSDNGLGMSEEKIASLYQHFKNQELQKGIGLKNIYQRLHLYYGERAQLTIESELDVGTTISILIPKEKEGSDD